MGNSLSYPVLSQFIERDGNQFVRVAVSSLRGYRPTMEDYHNIELDISGKYTSNNTLSMLFGVYDGHGGEKASKFLSSYVPKIFSNLTPSHFDNHQDLTQMMISLDKSFLATDDRSQGTTSIIVLASPIPINDTIENSTQLKLKIVNVGDSRAMVIRQDGTYLALSQDHHPENPIEYSRIVNAGGSVRNGRVDGDLALSRAIGDGGFKDEKLVDAMEQKVIPIPDFMSYVSDPTDIILICCDGIFEKLSYSQVADLVTDFARKNPQVYTSTFDTALIAQMLIVASINAGSTDNHTAMVIQPMSGLGYKDGYKTKELIPGPYLQFQEDLDFWDAYLDDLRSNGWEPDQELLEYIKTYELENKSPFIIDNMNENRR